MKTIFTCMLLSILSISYVFGQVIEEQEIELFKKYGVKERTKFDHRFTNDKPSSTGVKSSVGTYNKEGLIINTLTLNLKGDTVTFESYGYDDHNNRVFYERKSMSGTYKKSSEFDDTDKIILESGYDGSSAFKTMYKYNSADKLIEITYYADYLLDEKRAYNYDGNKAKVEILQKGKHLKSTIYLLYNNSEQIIEERIVSLEGVELEKRNVSYNSKGLMEQEEKYRTGKFAYRYSYAYDSEGRLTKVTEESPSKGKFDKKLYKYDGSGRVIEYKWTKKPNQKYNTKTFTYGDRGVCTEVLTFYPKTNYKLLTKYKYKFY